MSLTEHLAELRMRIIRAGLAVMLCSVLVFVFYNQVLDVLLRPYEALCERRIDEEFCGISYQLDEEGVRLVNLDPIKGLSARLKIAFYGGIALALPVLLWQIWRFVVPALHKQEKRYALGFVLSSVVLFLIGGLLAFSTLERALEFLIGWAGDAVTPAFEVEAYVSLVTLMVVAFGVGFTIPVMLVFLQLLGVLRPQTLLGAWRYAIVGTVFVAAAITPSGDPISLAALSGPLIVLYFLAILVGWLVQRARQRSEA